MLKVLIAEDEPLSLQNLSGQMRDLLGADALIEGVANGREAVERARQIQPQLVLMDITMPNMDGLEALKAIRSKDDKANVVMCSAMGQEAMVVEAVQAGIKDFIVKPFKEDRLMKTVNSILGNP